jgi:hypothetical protein
MCAVWNTSLLKPKLSGLNRAVTLRVLCLLHYETIGSRPLEVVHLLIQTIWQGEWDGNGELEHIGV